MKFLQEHVRHNRQPVVREAPMDEPSGNDGNADESSGKDGNADGDGYSSEYNGYSVGYEDGYSVGYNHGYSIGYNGCYNSDCSGGYSYDKDDDGWVADEREGTDDCFDALFDKGHGTFAECIVKRVMFSSSEAYGVQTTDGMGPHGATDASF